MSEGRSVEQWLSLAGGIVAPLGAVSALLFYFGYASTRAKYAYFGIDVDTVGLDTRDFLMRSPQPLLVPLVALAVVALFIVWLHQTIRRSIETRPGEHPDRSQRRAQLVRMGGAAVRASGALLLAIGMTLVVAFAGFGGWSAYDMVTPLCLMFGVLLVLYGRHLRTISTSPRTTSASLRRYVWILCAAVLAGCAFWASSTLAEWSGRGQAVGLTDRFGDLPKVILDTQERLYVQNPVINETVLPSQGGQTFRYRYRNLRLLVEGGDRLFLVPEKWSSSGTTLVVPLDSHVRVQFQFQNPG